MPEVKAGYWWAKLKINGSLAVIEIEENRLDLCYPTNSQDYCQSTSDWILLEYIPKYEEKNLEVKAGYWWAREKNRISTLQIIRIDEDLKNCWVMGAEWWLDLSEWELLKPIPEYVE